MTAVAPSNGILAMNPEFPVGSIGAASSALWNLINNATGTANSPWVPVTPFSRFALEVTSNMATYSVQLVGSCSLEMPSSAGTSNLGSAVASDGITFADYPGVRWVQAQLTNSGSGTVNVNLGAVAP